MTWILLRWLRKCFLGGAERVCVRINENLYEILALGQGVCSEAHAEHRDVSDCVEEYAVT